MAERLIVNLNRFNIPYGQVPMAKSEKNIRRRVWHVIYTPIHTLKPGLQKHGNVNRNFKTVKDHFYKVDVEISNNPKICRFLPTFFQLVGRQESTNFWVI